MPTAAAIAIVNDDRTYLELMQEVLNEEGYVVTMHARIAEALPLLLEQPPALLVVDMRFPGDLQGLDLITILRMHKQTANLPVIVCTAAVHDLTLLQSDLQRAGARLLRKPFMLDDMLAMIEIALKESVSSREAGS